MGEAIYAFILFWSMGHAYVSKIAIIHTTDGWKQQRVGVGDNITIECSTDIPCNMTWLKSAKSVITWKWTEKYCRTGSYSGEAVKLVKSNSHFNIVENENKTESDLSISNLGYGHTGYYTCITKTALGCDSAEKYLDVIGRSESKKISNWTISYSQWNSTTCQEMVISYDTNFLIEKTMTMVVQMEREFEDDVYNEYKCNAMGEKKGICRIGDINRKVCYDCDLTLLMFLREDISKIQIGSHKVNNIKYEDIRGPLSISADFTGTDSVELKWRRPWLSNCTVSSLDMEYFTEELCYEVNGSFSCMQPKKFKATIDNVTCGPENRRMKDDIHVCRYTKSGLKPNAIYTLRLSYSLEFIDQTWSKWSNKIQFTTKSKRPQVGPTVHCESGESSVYISLKLPPAEKFVSYEKFIIRTNGKTSELDVVPNQQEYDMTVKYAAEFLSVAVCAGHDICSGFSSKRCTSTKEDESKTRRIVIIVCAVAVVLILSLVILILYCRYSRRRPDSELDHRVELITPREQLTSVTSFDS